MSEEHRHRVYVEGRIERFTHRHRPDFTHSHAVIQQRATWAPMPRPRKKAVK